MLETAVDYTVLLVDDEADVRDVMKISLEELGYGVICAKDGVEAMALFKQHSPPIVLADIRMPNMDGIELLEKIKQIDPETEVIMITGHGDMNFAIKSFRFDATDFIPKPIGVDSLERALKRARDRIILRKQFYEYTHNLEKMLSEKSRMLQEGSGQTGSMQQVLQQLPCYISLYDKDLRIVEANSYFIENFGEAAGQFCYFVCRQQEAPCRDCPVKKTFERGKSCQHETEFINKDGRTRKVLVWTLPVFHPGESTVVDRVMSVATDLERISELQDHLSSLGLMMGSLSHGIKGLLTGLDSGMYLINSGMAKENGQRTEDGLRIVKETSEKLKKVVLDILFYAKEREFKKEKIQVKAFAEDISRVVESRIQSYGISFKKIYEEDPGEFIIDANYMLQALINILENAINACIEDKSKTGKHEIVLRVRSESDGRVRFEIKDNGIGMDKETRENMFNLFFSTRRSQGTGLGLFITRKVVEDHGGKIDVASTPGKGTTVTVYLSRGMETG
jgi:signal transduction histidine kinase/FixJ family two-component response regulator